MTTGTFSLVNEFDNIQVSSRLKMTIEIMLKFAMATIAGIIVRACLVAGWSMTPGVIIWGFVFLVSLFGCCRRIFHLIFGFSPFYVVVTNGVETRITKVKPFLEEGKCYVMETDGLVTKPAEITGTIFQIRDGGLLRKNRVLDQHLRDIHGLELKSWRGSSDAILQNEYGESIKPGQDWLATSRLVYEYENPLM